MKKLIKELYTGMEVIAMKELLASDNPQFGVFPDIQQTLNTKKCQIWPRKEE